MTSVTPEMQLQDKKSALHYWAGQEKGSYLVSRSSKLSPSNRTTYAWVRYIRD